MQFIKGFQMNIRIFGVDQRKNSPQTFYFICSSQKSVFPAVKVRGGAVTKSN